ncbi:MAG: sigma-70 family RNA polymerase sigma factor [Planctomycetia bacterium]|nr:sigma-70 family RNA polymerase sigma factor [Planctomycetia bacterium]
MAEPNEALVRLVRQLTQHHASIFAFIRALVPDRADAEEVLQETNLTLLRKVDEADRVENFRAWACAVARIEVLRFRDRRKSSRLIFADDFLELVAEVIVERADLLEDRREALTGCLDRLAERDRDLVRRRYHEAKDTQTVADEVGRSRDAVYKALARIRQTLFECVERRLAGGTA